MQLTMLKGKIHRAVVKQAELNYVGSITIDPKLMEAAGILEYEQVQIVDVENGNRFETYTIDGEPGSGMICSVSYTHLPVRAFAHPFFTIEDTFSVISGASSFLLSSSAKPHSDKSCCAE